MYYATDPTLTVANLSTVLEDVDCNLLWKFLQISMPRLLSIRQQHKSEAKRRQACWELFLNEHPSPSWKHVAMALYQSGYLNSLEVVQKKYLKGLYQIAY